MQALMKWLEMLGESVEIDAALAKQRAAEMGVDDATAQAVLNGDRETLEEHLGVRQTVVAFLVPSKEDDEDPSPQQDEPEEEPGEENSQLKRQHAAF